MEIKFCGADRTVTGSQHLLTINGKKVLLDCGLYQGKRELAYDINRNFPFDPKELHCVILSHAHIDHSGNLPSLTAKGFDGAIYSTAATKDLCSIMLQDSAHIQEHDTEFTNKKRAKKNLSPFKPLYTQTDAINTLTKFRTAGYNKTIYPDGLGGNVGVTYYDAGHILGSALVVLDINESGKKTRFAFTGDLGRPNLPILRDPDFIGDVDFLISESTYGNRIHDKAIDMDSQLAITLNEAIALGGKIIIPAFSVGRTQELVYSMSKLFAKKAIPVVPIFVDSPLSTSATAIFKLHPECYDREISDLIANGVKVFDLPNLSYISKAEDSKKLNSLPGPCIIISASGMCESGRILHHLSNNIEDPKATILIVGYMAENTLGRRLIESATEEHAVVNIYGEEHNVNAKIKILNSFSAHADKDELLWYMDKFNRDRLQNIYLVHGEIDQMEPYSASLKERGFKSVEIPVREQVFTI